MALNERLYHGGASHNQAPDDDVIHDPYFKGNIIKIEWAAKHAVWWSWGRFVGQQKIIQSGDIQNVWPVPELGNEHVVAKLLCIEAFFKDTPQIFGGG